MSVSFKNEAIVSYLPTMSKPSNAGQTMMEVIQIVNAHTADVLMSIMNILSKKYGHPVEDMMEAVRTNPAFHAIQHGLWCILMHEQEVLELGKEYKINLNIRGTDGPLRDPKYKAPDFSL